MEKENRLTKAVYVTDASGSMSSLTSAVKQSLATVLGEYKEAAKGGHNVDIDLWFFSTANNIKLVYSGPAAGIDPEAVASSYRVQTLTALYDATGKAIEHARGQLGDWAKQGTFPDDVVFFVFTDGLENASNRYNQRSVSGLIRDMEAVYGWDFHFIAAGFDGHESASKLGIGQTINVAASAEGITSYMETTRGRTLGGRR